MAKLKLVADPTFVAEVSIHRPGKDPVRVQMEFKYRTKTQLEEWHKTLEGKGDVDLFLEMVLGWPGQDEAFNRENVELLLETYHDAGIVTYRTYVKELGGARVKNFVP